MAKKWQTLQEFIDKMNGAPFDLEEFAEEAANVRDCDPIKYAALNYIDAKRKFEDELEDREIEVG
jgi:hypothetical protein